MGSELLTDNGLQGCSNYLHEWAQCLHVISVHSLPRLNHFSIIYDSRYSINVMSVTVVLLGTVKKKCLGIVQMQFFLKYFGFIFVWMQCSIYKGAPKQSSATVRSYWSGETYTKASRQYLSDERSYHQQVTTWIILESSTHLIFSIWDLSLTNAKSIHLGCDEKAMQTHKDNKGI